jgi:hypothetical protein
MALVQNVLIGKANGSVGNATFTQWKGKNVLKAKAVNSYSDPTQEQLNNNSKFAVLTAFARIILSYIQLGFKAMAVGKSEYNAFTQENPYSLTVTGSPGSYIVDTENIKVSKGPEFQEGIATAVKSSSGADMIVIDWTPSNFTRNTDIVYALAFNRTTGEFIVAHSEGVSAGSISLEAAGIGTNIATTDVYVFYVNGTNGKACDSRLVPTA